MRTLNIPVGVSDFEKIRNGDFYYIDKSGLIKNVLKEQAEVTGVTQEQSILWKELIMHLEKP